MDLTVKIIPAFFVLILLANYFNFIGFHYILKNLPTSQGRALRRKTKAYFLTMHALYAIVVFIACMPNLHPLCSEDKKYPRVMMWLSFLFLVNYCFHWYIFCKKDEYLVQEITAEEESLVSNSVNMDCEKFSEKKPS